MISEALNGELMGHNNAIFHHEHLYKRIREMDRNGDWDIENGLLVRFTQGMDGNGGCWDCDS